MTRRHAWTASLCLIAVLGQFAFAKRVAPMAAASAEIAFIANAEAATVVLLDVDKNEEVTYRLVTSEDADVTKGLISTTSPIGKSLLNKKESEEVEVKIPSGSRTFEILRFTTLHDKKD